MNLTRDEQQMLDGRKGKATQKAMELLVRYAEALGAERFVDTRNVAGVPGSANPFLQNYYKDKGADGLDAIFSHFDLDSDELTEFSAFTRRALSVVRAVSAPHGFNIGINAGSAAGAGIAEHLHQHVVPRWGGDSNFMPVIGQTKVLPQLLADTRRLLAQAWVAPDPVPDSPKQ